MLTPLGNDGLTPLGRVRTFSVPTFDFALVSATFTAGMAKRAAPGPFAAAPIGQGKWDGSGTGDSVTASVGSQVSGNFYANFDADQGAIVFWITPEWNGNDGIARTLFREGGLNVGLVKDTANRLHAYVGGVQALEGPSVASWVAGTAYNVVLRWDKRNTLDGTNYVCISINDAHSFGKNSAPGVSAPSLLNIIYSQSPAAIIEGLTIYRRPLYDGAYGINAGNGDEINLIYNAGAGRDACAVTGSWDVVFAVPTNSTVGALVTGTGEAWSHPHSSNLVTPADGFMLGTAWANWSQEGTPASGAVLATGEKIFAGGYKFESNAANEGYYFDIAVSAGNDWVVRAIAHSDGTSQPKVVLYDQTNGAEIGSLTGTTTSTRTAPDVLILTGEAPAGCTTLRVKLINTAASGVCHFHQVEALPNLLTNPSFASGSGDPWIPTGWTNNGLSAGQGVQEATIVHSGASAFKITSGASTGFGITRTPSVSAGFHCVGAWQRGNGYLFGDSVVPDQTLFSGSSLASDNVGATWTHRKKVVRATGASPLIQALQGSGDTYFDDYYMLALTAVSLTVTPASAANSDEASGRRVDGRDTLVQSITGLTTTRGRIRWRYTPRHSAADVEKFVDSSPPFVAVFAGDGSNYILVFWSAANTLTLNCLINGVPAEVSWNATGAIAAGTTYAFELEYTGGGAMTLKIDGTTRITLSAIPAFSVVPAIAYWGANGGAFQRIADATFAAP